MFACCCVAAGTCLPPDLLADFTTRIWMRLRPGKTAASSSSSSSSSRAELSQQLCQLDPLMLLNLRKLRCGCRLFVGVLSWVNVC
jgi:hypothetical protein